MTDNQAPKTPYAKATGWIVWQGVPHHVQVDTPLLVMDTVSWAASIRLLFEEAAAEAAATRSRALALADQARAKGKVEQVSDYQHIATAEMLNIEAMCANAEEVRRWLETGEGKCNVIQPLALRQCIAPLQVNKECLGVYLQKVLAISDEAHPLLEDRFLLLADEITPILYGNETIRMAVSHTGREILGVSLSTPELQMRIDEMHQRYAAAHSQAMLDRHECHLAHSRAA